MTEFTVGQRVRYVRTNEEVARDIDLFLGSPFVGLHSPEQVEAIKNQPTNGETGTVVKYDSDFGDYLIKFDRRIGVVTGDRTAEDEWFVHPDHIEAVAGEPALAQAA